MPKFDPMTGELIAEETKEKETASITESQTDVAQTTEQAGKQFVPRFDPMTGQPILTAQPQPQTPKKSHKTAIIVSVIVGVVVLIEFLQLLLA